VIDAVEPPPEEVRPWLVAIIVLWAAAYLPELAARDLRGEEGRRAIPAREMLERGDYMLPTLFGDPYLNKPPLHYWMIGLIGAMRGGVDVWATRIPSALAALACGLLMMAFGKGRMPLAVRGTAALAALATPILLDKGTQGEIDALLTAFVLAAWVVWWSERQDNETSWRGWLAAGALLGLATLCKGLGGPTQFYLGIATWLVWKGRLRELVSARHACALIFMAAPAVAWVAGLVYWRGISLEAVTASWRGQSGLAAPPWVWLTFPYARAYFLAHIVEMVEKIPTMSLPWCVLAAPAFAPRFAKRLQIDGDLRRFLCLTIAANFVVFLLLPTARPRYLMAAVLLVCPLAAASVRGLAGVGATRLLTVINRLPTLMVHGAVGLAVVGAIAALKYTEQFEMALLLLGAAGTWLVLMGRLGRQLRLQGAVLAAALTLAGLILVGRGTAANIALPILAKRDEVRKARALLPSLADRVVFTTRRFPERSEDWYEVFFHIAQSLRGAETSELVARAPCLALVTPAEADELEQRAPGKCWREGVVPKLHDCSTGLVLVRIVSPTLVDGRQTSPAAR